MQNVEQIIHRTVGSREPIGARLLKPDRTADDIAGHTIVFRLVKADGTVMIDNAAASIVDAPTAKVKYVPGVNELAEGTYAMYFRDETASPAKQWPPEGRLWQLEVHAEKDRPS